MPTRRQINRLYLAEFRLNHGPRAPVTSVLDRMDDDGDSLGTLTLDRQARKIMFVPNTGANKTVQREDPPDDGG